MPSNRLLGMDDNDADNGIKLWLVKRPGDEVALVSAESHDDLLDELEPLGLGGTTWKRYRGPVYVPFHLRGEPPVREIGYASRAG